MVNNNGNTYMMRVKFNDPAEIMDIHNVLSWHIDNSASPTMLCVDFRKSDGSASTLFINFSTVRYFGKGVDISVQV